MSRNWPRFILTQRAHPPPDDQDDDRSSANEPPHNLPLALTSFHGRERELADLGRLLKTHRLVTLTGAGGIGKTRLALEIAFDLVTECAAGTWFVELAPLSDGSFVAGAVAQVLGVREVPNQPLLATLVAYLKHKTTLLLFDNCEHMVEEVARIADALLRSCGGVRIVATSREPLRIAGEHAYRLPSLTFPTLKATRALRADEANAYAALPLFVERAQAADHRFALTDENAPIIADICRRLDGIPLAIELAAARVTLLSPQQLCERLDERFRVLTGGSCALLPRHQTLRALIEWSHDLLDERERRLFRHLGVFANGFTLESAFAVAYGGKLGEPNMVEGLASLVDKSLVLAEPNGDELRYRMLESTRFYAREKLEAAGELPTSVSRHRRYLRDLFVAARMDWDRSGRSTAMDVLLVTELENVRVALDQAADDAEAKTNAELLAALGDRWNAIGLGSEGISRLEQFIALMPADELWLIARFWTTVARIAELTDPVRAREAAFTAVGLARDAYDSEVLADALVTYAQSLARTSTFEEATAALTEAEALAPAANVGLHLSILRMKARLKAFPGSLMSDLDGAAQDLEQLRKIHLQLGNAFGANVAAIGLAEVEHQRGRTEKAVALVQEVLSDLRIGRDERALLQALANLCGYLIALGRLSEARSVAQEAFRNSPQDMWSGVPVTSIMEHTALTVALDGNVRLAVQLAGYTEAAFSRVGYGYRRQYTERTTRTLLEGLLNERLAADELNLLLVEGAVLSPEDAIALALGSLAG